MKHELLAPAGNLNIFYAVIRAGADAVYIGGPKFGARAYAQNFTQEEILSAICYAHLHGVKVYMTVNTLVKNEELEDCIQMMIPFYEAGLDGVIVQDIGILHAFSRQFPGLELHASTQMSISDVEGAKLLKEAGVTRVVTSRELSLQEIKQIRQKAEIELECFVHGALCYCYSGQCLMSSMIGGRSGNRGRCAQPCRLAYEVQQEDGTVRKPTSTILSLKDLCTIQFLPQILDAGVDSLKIEGRMKQASYAYTVVGIYRKYMDLYEKNGADGYRVTKEDYQKLLDAGNREGFTDGYYFEHNGKQMLTASGSAHNSSAGEQKEDEICTPIQLLVCGEAVFQKGSPAKLSIQYKDTSVTVEGAMVEEARTCGIDQDKVKRQLNKTGGSYVSFEKLSVTMDPDIFLPVSELNSLRRNAVDAFYKAFSVPRIYRQNLGDKKQSGTLDRQIEVSVLVSDFRRMPMLLTKDYIHRIYIELFSLKEEEMNEVQAFLEQVKAEGKEVFAAFPFVLRAKSKQLLTKRVEQLSALLDGLLVRSYDGLGFARQFDLPIVTDEPLYSFSDEANHMLISGSVMQDTIPYELGEREIKNRENRFSEWVIYGRVPVMISAGCVHKNTKTCDGKSEILYLKDRKNYRFPVRNECNGCYNVIYNSTPTCLFNSPLKPASFGVKSVRLQFTAEDSRDMEKVFALFEKQVLNMPLDAEPIKDFTWGHFKKGVL